MNSFEGNIESQVPLKGRKPRKDYRRLGQRIARNKSQIDCTRGKNTFQCSQR